VALLVGEWDETRRRDDLEDRLEHFAAFAEWAFAEHERRAQDWMRARQIAAVAELARTTASPCNLAEVMHQAARLACQASGGRGSALWLRHEGDALRLEITHGSPAQRDRHGRALQPLAEQTVKSGRLRIGDCAADEALLSPDAAAAVRSFAVLPLRAYDRVLGAIAVYDPSRLHVGHPLAFGRGELESLGALADLTAVAIDHATRFAELSAANLRHRELAARLARQERLAMLGETASRIADEARHPVNSIRTFSRRAREALVEGQPEREYLEIVLRETERLERLLGEHLDRTEVEPPSLQLQNLNEIVQANVQRIGDVLVRRRIRLLKKLSPELPRLLIDADRIGHMMSRVLENALEAVSIGGRIRVETRRAGSFAVVEVAHDGPRSPGTALDHLFVPFANSRNGAGVGLGLAQRVVREHGGEVRVRADGEWSTVVVFTLPIPDNQDRRRGIHERRLIRNDRRRRIPQK
jgi:signal transduction histidine kinase